MAKVSEKKAKEMAIKREVGNRVRDALNKHFGYNIEHVNPDTYARTNSDEGDAKKRVTLIEALIATGVFEAGDQAALYKLSTDALEALTAKLKKVTVKDDDEPIVQIVEEFTPDDEDSLKLMEDQHMNCRCHAADEDLSDLLPRNDALLDAICKQRGITGYQRDKLIENTRKRNYIEPHNPRRREIVASAAEQEELKALLPPSPGDLMRGTK